MFHSDNNSKKLVSRAVYRFKISNFLKAIFFVQTMVLALKIHFFKSNFFSIVKDIPYH